MKPMTAKEIADRLEEIISAETIVAEDDPDDETAEGEVSRRDRHIDMLADRLEIIYEEVETLVAELRRAKSPRPSQEVSHAT